MALTLEQQLAQNAAKRRARLGTTALDIAPTTKRDADAERDEAAREVAIERVQANPENARQIDLSDPEQAADMESLVQSIQTHGLLQPPLVRPLQDDRFEVIAGDRRVLAARRAGLQRIPVRVREAEAAVLRQLNLVENLVRSNLSAADMGHGFAKLKAALEQGQQVESGQAKSDKKASSKKATPGSRLKWEDVAAVTGLTPRSMQRYIAIANLIEELELPAAEKTKVARLKEKQLRPALLLDSPEQRGEFVRQVAEEKLSSRQAEERAKAIKSGVKKEPKNSSRAASSNAVQTTVNDPMEALRRCEEDINKALQGLQSVGISASLFKRQIRPRLDAITHALSALESLAKKPA